VKVEVYGNVIYMETASAAKSLRISRNGFAEG
jgi:hypothetical protein